MAKTLDRGAQRRVARRADIRADEPVQIDEKKLERARKDPGKKAFAKAARTYGRRVRKSGAGN